MSSSPQSQPNNDNNSTTTAAAASTTTTTTTSSSSSSSSSSSLLSFPHQEAWQVAGIELTSGRTCGSVYWQFSRGAVAWPMERSIVQHRITQKILLEVQEQDKDKEEEEETKEEEHQVITNATTEPKGGRNP